MDALRQDLRFGLRLFRRSPGLTLAAVLSMALGIGANTLTFSLVHALLLRPLPFADAERLILLSARSPAGNNVDARVSYRDYQDLWRRSASFSAMGGFLIGYGLTFTEEGPPERVEVGLVSDEILPMLGVEPLLGRHMLPEEAQEPVLLLGYDFWQRRFGGDPEIVGRQVIGNSIPFTVVGVMPPGFQFPFSEIQAWVPLENRVRGQDPAGRGVRIVRVMGRLRPGVSTDEAAAEIAALGRDLEKEHPRTHAGWSLETEPLRHLFLSEGIERRLLLSLGAVLCVLLIACANVANLLLAQAAARQREIATRAAFGATPARIVRQLLTESGLIAAAGGLAGLALALGGMALMRSVLPPLLPWLVPRLDTPLLLFTLATTLGTGLLFGLAPALECRRIDLHPALKDGARGASGVPRRRLRAALVIAEVAVSMVLLIGASLFLRSFLAFHASFEPVASKGLLSFWTYLPGESYQDSEERTRMVETTRRRLAEIPGVEAVAATNSIQLGVSGAPRAPVLPGVGGCERIGTDTPVARIKTVSSGLFRTLGLPLAAGRDLTPDEATAPSGVAVVNQTMARLLWPAGGAESALGKAFLLCEGQPLRLTVVGVSPDLKDMAFREEVIPPTLYVSMAYNSGRPAAFLLRAHRPDEEILTAARRTIRAADPGLPVFLVHNLAQRRDEQLAFDRLFGEGFALFGGSALLLAAIGVYGVLAYGVSQRLREIGIRVALGAGHANVLWLVAGQGVLLTLAGIGLGLLAALLAARSMQELLYGVSPTDTASFLGMAILLVDVAFIACYLPARRALDVDPVEILRGE
jgi:putative ABC transport system permease protein